MSLPLNRYVSRMPRARSREGPLQTGLSSDRDQLCDVVSYLYNIVRTRILCRNRSQTQFVTRRSVWIPFSLTGTLIRLNTWTPTAACPPTHRPCPLGGTMQKARVPRTSLHDVTMSVAPLTRRGMPWLLTTRLNPSWRGENKYSSIPTTTIISRRSPWLVGPLTCSPALVCVVQNLPWRIIQHKL